MVKIDYIKILKKSYDDMLADKSLFVFLLFGLLLNITGMFLITSSLNIEKIMSLEKMPFLIIGIISILLSGLPFLYILIKASHNLDKKRKNKAVGLSEFVSLFFRFIGSYIFVYFILVLIIAILVLLGILIFTGSKAIILNVMLLLFIGVPALLVIIYGLISLIYLTPKLVIDKAGPIEAVIESFKHMKERFVDTLVYIGFMFIISMLASIPYYIISGIVTVATSNPFPLSNPFVLLSYMPVYVYKLYAIYFLYNLYIEQVGKKKVSKRKN